MAEGPTVVSSGATPRPNSDLGANSFISDDTKIGAAVEIEHSVLASAARLPHPSHVGDSVVDPRATVGAGSIVAKLRRDDAPATLSPWGERYSTGRGKFGIVGEGETLGTGTRLKMGTIVAPGATTEPGEVVRRDGRSETP